MNTNVTLWRIQPVCDEYMTSMWRVSNDCGSTYKQTENTMSYNIFILIIIIIIIITSKYNIVR